MTAREIVEDEDGIRFRLVHGGRAASVRLAVMGLHNVDNALVVAGVGICCGLGLGAVADGLATAIAVLGVEKGMELVEKTEGVECLLLELAETPAEGAEPPALVAHRSSGFAALEFDPSATDRPLHPDVRPAPRR